MKKIEVGRYMEGDGMYVFGAKTKEEALKYMQKEWEGENLGEEFSKPTEVSDIYNSIAYWCDDCSTYTFVDDSCCFECNEPCWPKKKSKAVFLYDYNPPQPYDPR